MLMAFPCSFLRIYWKVNQGTLFIWKVRADSISNKKERGKELNLFLLGPGGRQAAHSPPLSSSGWREVPLLSPIEAGTLSVAVVGLLVLRPSSLQISLAVGVQSPLGKIVREKENMHRV